MTHPHLQERQGSARRVELPLRRELLRREDLVLDNEGQARTVTRIQAGETYVVSLTGGGTLRLEDRTSTARVLARLDAAPTPAQFRAIAYVLAAGGADVPINKVPGTLRSLATCERNGWLERITHDGGRASMRLGPYGRAALERAGLRTESASS